MPRTFRNDGVSSSSLLSGTIFKYKIKLLKQYDISTLPLWRFMEPLWNQGEPKSRALERAIAVLRHCFDPLKATFSRYKCSKSQSADMLTAEQELTVVIIE